MCCYLTRDSFVINKDYKLACYFTSLGLSGHTDSLFLSVKILVVSQVSESTFVVTIRLEGKSLVRTPLLIPVAVTSGMCLYLPPFVRMSGHVWGLRPEALKSGGGDFSPGSAIEQTC